jgi:glycosyltransferase involved in cell wall biosynthesis
MTVEPVAASARLRIAVLGDFDGPHARSWLRWFVERGHEMHAISFYPPRDPIEGVTLHALRPQRARSGGAAGGSGGASRVPRGLLRFAHGARYLRAGLRSTLRDIAPDVFHAHYVVEHGFYGALARFHPYVVTAWGSDVLVEPRRERASRMIAGWTLRYADLATSNNAYMAERMVDLGAPRDRVALIVLGADADFLAARERSVNVRAARDASGDVQDLVVLSTRAHERLYNINEIIAAYDRATHHRGGTRLVVAHGGSMTQRLQRQAAVSSGRIEMLGFVDRAALLEEMLAASVFVSIPSSDGTSVALLQAMAAGSIPIVTDLPTQREWIDDGVNGFRVALHRPDLLAERIRRALDDEPLRRAAAVRNAAIVEERGLNEHEMLKMEAHYRRLAGRHGLRAMGGPLS